MEALTIFPDLTRGNPEVPSYSQAHHTRCNTTLKKAPTPHPPPPPPPYAPISMLREIYMDISCNFTVKGAHTHTHTHTHTCAYTHTHGHTHTHIHNYYYTLWRGKIVKNKSVFIPRTRSINYSRRHEPIAHVKRRWVCISERFAHSHRKTSSTNLVFKHCENHVVWLWKRWI